ncbi:MAG: hypothetical protein SVU32_08370, partial [Candidatus Nanohaloarchaea archaeon]|nr:hypothetical protein [Candidatus Nanohaloarchaea archaeon]
FESLEEREGTILMFRSEEYAEAAGFVESLLDINMPDDEPRLARSPAAVDTLLTHLDTDGRQELVSDLMEEELGEGVETLLDEKYAATVEQVGDEELF